MNKCSLHKVFFSFIFFPFAFYNSSFTQPINWDSVRQAYFDKYQPTDTPAWLFPIIFEEWTGQRDTIYIGYDTNAYDITQPGFDGDSVFGEKKILIDTTKFNVNICGSWFGCGGLCDSVKKVWITKFANTSNCGDVGYSFEFLNGYLPLKLYWDVNLFRSDSLPFPNQSPAPRAQGSISYDGWSLYPDNSYMKCFIDYPILLTDTGVFSCIKKDSLIFYFTMDTTQNIPIPYFYFGIEPWTGDWVGLFENNNGNPKIKINPNPFSNVALINIPENIFKEEKNIIFSLYDIFGNELKRLKINTQQYELKRNNLPSGIYFYKFYNNQNLIYHGKLIIY